MIPAVILAAGASARMGRPKALLPIGSAGETFVTRLMHTFTATPVDDLVVVVGADADAAAAAVRRCDVPARLVLNREYHRGQLSSLVAALDVVDRPGVRAVMVMPVDMPLVSVGTVRAVIEEYRRGAHLIVRPERNGSHGHPVIFDRALFDELRAADFSKGARSVIAAHADRAFDVRLPGSGDPGAFIDIDTPEDYRRYVE